MSDIFISYASEDKNRVKTLAHALEKRGWSVWWDQRIPIGRSYDEVIEEALDASKAVVVVWTNTSVKSQWVKNEAREGLRRRVLFPVMLLEAVRIPLEFRDVQAAHLIDWQPEQDHPGFDHFVDDIARLIGIPIISSVQAPHIPLSQERSSPPASPTLESSLPKTAVRVEPVRAALAENNDLSSLTLSPGTLNPAFAASTTNYTVYVASDVTSVNISATKADSNAVLAGDVTVGSVTATGQATIPLNGPGTTTLAVITVTAPNGNSKTYRITVNRAAPSGNNSLSALKVSPGALSPVFNANTLSYTADVASTVDSIRITPTRQDPNATIKINAQAATSGQARTITLNGAGSNTLINIVVTAPNGSQKTYTIAVQRAALASNNNLSALMVSPPGSISPAFTASTTQYTANVGSAITSITVKATKADADAVMSGDITAGAGVTTGQAAIQLGGPGTITGVTIWVTAPAGSQKTYTLNVSRAAFAGNNNLQSLSVSPGALSPSFSASGTAYTVNVDAKVTSVTVTTTLKDINSIMTINGQRTHAGQTRSITLAPAGSSTEIEIIVTASNGRSKTYLITVSRAALPQALEVELERERLEQKQSDAISGVLTSDATVESQEVEQDSTRVGEDRSLDELIGSTSTIQFLSYLPIGIGLLVAIGALVYVVVFSQIPSPESQPIAGPTNTIISKDGAPMVLVPEGEFMMGSSKDDESANGDEQPTHSIYLDSFYID